MDPYICTSQTCEAWMHSPGWRVSLSDGVSVYSQDGRRSWMELKEYLKNSNIYITGLWIQFRDHVVCVGEGPKDYILISLFECWYGDNQGQYNYLVGYREGDKVKLDKYKVPELVYVSTEYRELTDASVLMGMIVSGKE